MTDTADYYKDRVLNLLKLDSSEEFPITSKRIQRQFNMNDVEVRQTIRQLRLDCHPVGSGPRGFYYARKGSELNASIADLKSRVAAIVDVIKKLEDAKERLLDDDGQRLLDL
ncbi:MAG: hypothetical protein Tp1111DCM1112741_25 [Prokaryotic dsDNA virus sp.]|nr:MAG: hypothetical protein Tp1111DCM1112741_25 [Prokaryotic dsDNA virus sp.]|tara:strand:- start:5881 stop:6216 length:336 start_codon:yes stop_codon:yes gene_type:complete